MRYRQVLLGTGAGTVLALSAIFVQKAWSAGAFPGGSEPRRFDAPLGTDAPRNAPSSAPAAPTREGEPTPQGRPRSERSGGGSLVATLGESVGADVPVLPEPSPKPEAFASPDALHPELYLGALSKETVIHEKPSLRSKTLGFARTGAILRRAALAKGTEGCKDGWYLVEPAGYVCVGRTATLDVEHPVLKIASYQPDRSLPLPYPYGRSRYPTPPLYTKVPTLEEQKLAEPDLAYHKRAETGVPWTEDANAPSPALLADGARIPRPFGYPVLTHEFMTGRALGNSAFAFIDLFQADGRSWGLTADLSLLPLDRLTKVETSDFSGLILSGEVSLPVAFTRSEKQNVYAIDPTTNQVTLVRPARYREGFSLSGSSKVVAGKTFYETRSGEFLREDPRLVLIRPPEKFPKYATGDQTWIDVSLVRQTLVAYRGARPVFATLVSTGRDGTQDPLTTHSTVQGLFRIHTKHVTATMSGNSADDEFDLRDVPYVQYFHEGYAFHAAFWHDGFGSPRSHGCVNLSPRDARYLFTWTEPPVPMRWHSALSMSGTLVNIHP